MTRTMLFHREFHGYSGGHGKVWDYFRHVRAYAGWDARVHFTPDSIAEGNPWRNAGVPELEEWQPSLADAMFIAGMDWLAWPHDERAKPVVNLLQGVRHADLDSPLRGFLSRPAIRICVGQPIADAIAATGLTKGPVFVVESGIDIGATDMHAQRPIDVFIAAQKQPALGVLIAERLQTAGVLVDCVSTWLPRGDFLARMRQARVAVTLPLAREGFYLPGLEAMASGCAVVMPDAVGNRAYAASGRNAIIPAMDADAVASDTLDLLRDTPRLQSIAAAGIDTASRHTIARERAAFHRILDNLEQHWAQAWDATSH